MFSRTFGPVLDISRDLDGNNIDMMAHEAVSAAAPDANAPSSPPSSSSSGVNVFRVPHSRLNIFPMKIKKKTNIIRFFFQDEGAC